MNVEQQLVEASAERDAERSRFASWADTLEALVVEMGRQPGEWGHLRYRIQGVLTTAVVQFKHYAAGQPSPQNYRRRAEAAEQREQALRDEVDLWKHCANCHTPLQAPGHCQHAHVEEVQGLNAMFEESLAEREKLEVELQALRDRAANRLRDLERVEHWEKVISTGARAVIDSAAGPQEQSYQCAVRRAGKTDLPQDCDWPFCGCDPHADKVIEAIQESGRLSPRDHLSAFRDLETQWFQAARGLREERTDDSDAMADIYESHARDLHVALARAIGPTGAAAQAHGFSRTAR